MITKKIKIIVMLFFLGAYPMYGAEISQHILLIWCALPFVESINATDQWVFQTTNAQTAIGGVGLLTMTFNFISGYLFYLLMQEKLAGSVRIRIAELERVEQLKAARRDHRDRSIRALEDHIAKEYNFRPHCEVIDLN